MTQVGIWDQSNEGYASMLIDGNPTKGLSDHFFGTALRAGWVNEATATAATVGNSSLSVSPAAGATTHWLRSWTPTGDVMVDARVRATQGTSGQYTTPGLLIRDSQAGEGGGVGEGVLIQLADGVLNAFTLNTGTYAQFAGGGAPVTLGAATGYGPIYLRLYRTNGNNWYAYYSLDRALWVYFMTAAKTLTIAKAGFRFVSTGNPLPVSADFIDAVS